MLHWIKDDKRNDIQQKCVEWDRNLLVYCLHVWNALSHIIPDIWQPSDKAAIKNWKTPRMKPSPWKFYTVNKIDIKGLYVDVYIWPGLLCHVASVSVKVHMGLHFLTSPRSSMLSSSTCRIREYVKKSSDNGSSGWI